VANDRERGSSGGGGGAGCTRSAVPPISCRDLEIDETRCYPETMARPTKCAPRVCGSLLQTSRFEIERRARLLPIAAVTFRTGPFFFCAAANPIPFSGKKTLCRTDTSRTSEHIDLRNARAFLRFFFTPPRRRPRILYYYVERIIIILLLLRTVFTCTRFTTTVTIAARRVGRSLSGHRKLLQNVKSLNFFILTLALISLNCHVRITCSDLTSYRTDSTRDFPTAEIAVVMARPVISSNYIIPNHTLSLLYNIT